MGEPGYLYALINHAMPGLVKVGRTTHAPSDRMGELSGATGVPTPFELVYDVLVPDAGEAEAAAHNELSRSGYRVAENREFFRAPIREVVQLLLTLREQMAATGLARFGSGDLVVATTPTLAEPIDALIREAAEVCVQHNHGTTSLLQRRLKIGYGRAARLVDQLHSIGVLGPPQGSAPRDVLTSLAEAQRICDQVARQR